MRVTGLGTSGRKIIRGENKLAKVGLGFLVGRIAVRSCGSLEQQLHHHL